MQNQLVINLGLKSIRVIVFNESGEQIYSNSKPVFSRLRDDRVEQSAKEWRQHLDALLFELRDQTSLAATIDYVTSTTSSSCIYGADESGEPTTPVMMVSDKRSKVQSDRIVDLNSFRNSPEGTCFRCSPSSTLPKILWYKEVEPETFAKTHKWLGAGEFLNHFVTREFVTDPLNASKAFYDGTQYHSDIFREVGVDPAVLPKVSSIGTVFEIPKKVSAEYGLNENCKFVLTTYDAICAVVGAYDGSGKTACDVSGTVTSVRVLTDQTVPLKDDSVVLSQELGLENKRLIGASNNLGGGIAEWCKQAFYDENDKNVYFTMENSAHNSSIGAKGMLFLPYLLGERAPFKSTNAKGTFFGISRYSTNDDFTRAVFESTAFVTKDLLNLSVDAGLEVDSLSVSGGLARFDLINQIKADVTNVSVKVIENFESTSVGAWILMSLAIGKYSSLGEACSTAVRIRKIINPSKKNHEIYKEYFELYKSINTSLMAQYEKHSHIMSKIRDFSPETLRNL
jgi:xylulokinase